MTIATLHQNSSGCSPKEPPDKNEAIDIHFYGGGHEAREIPKRHRCSQDCHMTPNFPEFT